MMKKLVLGLTAVMLAAPALAQQAQDEAQMESEYLGLKPPEQVVLWRPDREGGALTGTPDDDRFRYLRHD
jgi:hypothetical protein